MEYCDNRVYGTIFSSLFCYSMDCPYCLGSSRYSNKNKLQNTLVFLCVTHYYPNSSWYIDISSYTTRVKYIKKML